MYLNNLVYISLASFLTLVEAHSPSVANRLSTRAVSRTRVCSADAIDPPPAGYKCNFQGVLKNPKTSTPITTRTVASLTECRDACMLDSSCVTFTWQPATGSCKLYSTNVASKKPKSPSGIYFYQRECFNSPTFYDPMPLVNSGFEKKGLRPKWVTTKAFDGSPTTRFSAVIDPHADGNSQKSLLLDIGPLSDAGTHSGYINVRQTVGMCPGVPYDFGWSFQVSNFGDDYGVTSTFQSRVFDGSTSLAQTTSQWSPDSKWFNVGLVSYTPAVSGPVSVQAITSLISNSAINQNGDPRLSVAFDNFYLAASDFAASPAFPTCTDEPITNGDFETGDLTGWSISYRPSSGTYQTIPDYVNRQGQPTHVAYMTIYGPPDGSLSPSTFTQQIQVCADQTYAFSYDYYVAGAAFANNHNPVFKASVTSFNNYRPVDESFVFANTDQGQWRTAGPYTFAVPNSEPVRIQFGIYPPDADARAMYVYLDNVKVVPV